MLKISNILPVDATVTIWAADDSSLVYAGKYAMHAKDVAATSTDWVLQLHFQAYSAVWALTGVTATSPFLITVQSMLTCHLSLFGRIKSISPLNFSLSRRNLAAHEQVKLGLGEAQTCRRQVLNKVERGSEKLSCLLCCFQFLNPFFQVVVSLDHIGHIYTLFIFFCFFRSHA